MKIFSIFFNFFLFFFLCAKADDKNLDQLLLDKIVTNLPLSDQCEGLIKKRKEKIIYRQKLGFLAKRNRKLTLLTPANKITIKKKLKKNITSIDREIKITNLKIQSYEEKIIRKGCSFISL